MNYSDRKGVDDQLSKQYGKGLSGCWNYECESKQMTFSDEVFRILGFTSENPEFSYEKYLGCIYHEDLDNVKNLHKELFQNNRNSYEVKYRIIHQSSGKLLSIEEKCFPLKDNLGKPKFVIGIIQDLTEQKLSMAEENEEKLFAFINSIPDIICFKDPYGRWLLANEADLKLFGLEGVDYQGKTDLDLSFYTHDIYKEAFKLCMETDEVAWQKRTLSKGIEVIATTTGEKKVFDVYKIPVFYNNNGERKGMAIIGREITELYLAQQNLIAAKELAEENEEKFKQIAENSNEAFWLRNDKQFFYINPAFEKIFGVKIELAQANPGVFIEMIHPEDKSKVLTLMAAEEYKKRGFFEYEYRIIRPDKEVRWVLAKGSPIYNSNGEIIRRLGFASDITVRKQAEIDLFAAKVKAEESDRLKTAFIQNMSHEIRTPMNAIMGFSELLTRNLDNKAKLEHYSGIIAKCSNDLLKIINDLLDIARIESGQMRVFIEKIEIEDLFSELKETFLLHHAKIKKPNISLDYKINADARKRIIKTDKLKLKQIFTNLIGNALKFTECGKVEFGCDQQQDNTLVFYVSDTGIGVPKDKFDLIFKRFAQVHNEEKSGYGGTGLGLSIVKGLMDLLGGRIWMQSEENKGSTFYFTIKNI